ncbi:hypothetical protein [Parabacteroides merdae]|uniref:Uncharacterized protein n=1 Tax=Parabacteroides merdae TaxID=46503 RepID=A0A414XJE2_9BACT|nr:hypothetical protein [Parabacteroides merdae]RHH74034.1 hypothetical protein DW191_19240 [Parabacteroides merdae]
MIGLDKIGLNQVQLNRLRLNAPFPAYGKMAGGGGSGDGFPQLPGDVTRWHFGGLTNEMMADMDDPRLEDADGKGRFLSFKNFAWKEGSGISDVYPGALVFDGVDDYGTCNNFPVLTKGKGYTVVVLRQWITRGKGALGLVSNVKNWLNNGAFLLEYRNIQADHLNKPISFGAIGSEMDLPHILTYQTSKSYNGVSITTGNFEGTDVLHVGKLAPTNVGTCINAAIWELVFLDHDATEEELTKIKDYFVKTYPWLFPDQAWTVTGKTNEDEDRATIANITGNGNDLILSNFGFIEGSGYNEEGEYAGYLVTDGVDDKAVSKQFKFGKNFTVILDFKFPVKKISYCGFDLSSKVRIQNLQGSGVYVVLKGNKTLIPSNVVRAVTSEGKVYDENWNEYNIVPGNISSNYTMVNLGFDGSNQFAESATKLAGIYSSTLSKDDCIKAYNYLQTLKAK